MKTQISIGNGSLGLMYRDVDATEIDEFVALAAATMGYSAEVVQQKLAAGGTLWLNRAEGQKIRGYDAAAAQQRAAQQAAERQQRLAADGYWSNL